MRLCVSVGDADVDDTVGAAGSEAAHRQIVPLAVTRLSGQGRARGSF